MLPGSQHLLAAWERSGEPALQTGTCINRVGMAAGTVALSLTPPSFFFSFIIALKVVVKIVGHGNAFIVDHFWF